MKETDLAEHVIDWLEADGWDVYQEVRPRQYGKIADIVAVRHGWITWIIETKTSLTFDVLEQAHSWRMSHYISIAIPAVKRRSKGRQLAEWIAHRHLGLGILTLGRYGHGIDVAEVAPLHREYHEWSKRELLPALRPEHKHFARAGSANGHYYTPYRHTMMNVQRIIEKHPGITLRAIMQELADHHYVSDQSAKQGIRRGLDLFEDWCRVDKSEREYRYFVADTDQAGRDAS